MICVFDTLCKNNSLKLMDAGFYMLDNLNSVSASLINLAVSYGIDILTGFGIILVGFWLSARLSRFIIQTLAATQRVDKTLIPVFAAIIRYSVVIITIVVALGQVGVQTTSMIAVLGAAGLAIGLALQGTLSNVAAGVMLLLLRPFEVDDWITAAGVSGTVREIGLFSTNIDTFDNVYHSVPNSTIWSSEITNHSRHENRRLDFDIDVAYDSDFDIVEKALLSLCDDERIHQTPAPRFLVINYGDSAITVRLRLYTSYSDLFELNWDLMRRVKPLFDRHEIDIPFPQRVVHSAKEVE